MTQAPPVAVRVTRRDLPTGDEVVESVHRVHVVLVRDGERVAALGDPDRLTFPRSAVKPVQARACLAILDEAGWPGGRPGDDEIAIAWASHRAQPEHVAVVERLCARASISTAQLTCPPDRAPDGPADVERRILHNCSGKHALFALTGRVLGVTGPALLDPAGPLQSRLLTALADHLPGVQGHGVDGCGAPAVRAPLSSLASLFADVATHPDWSVIRTAGFAHPRLVGGAGRLESALLAGGTVAKLGAEGVYAAGWEHAGARVGVAVKAEDGDIRGAAAVLAAIAGAAGRDLRGWAPQAPTSGSTVVGRVEVAAEVAALVDALA